MKTSELMIGDLLYLNRRPVRVDAIGFNGSISYSEKGGFGGIGIDKLSPIPITEDILVKNGFERCDYNNQYFIIDDVIDLITPKWRGGTEYYACAWYQDEFDDLVQHIEICKCAYVHQLQHLLRLVGIQKEIEL